MADTPSQNFGTLPDTLTFGPFGPDGDIIVHIENLVLGCLPYVQNIGVPFVCAGEETASMVGKGSYIEWQMTTSTGYYTVRNAGTGVETIFADDEYQTSDGGTYCVWASDAAGAKSGQFNTFGLLTPIGIGDESLDFTGTTHLTYLQISDANLKNVILSSMPDCVFFQASPCKLSQSSVDDILVAIASNGLAANVYLADGTSAAPSATGLAAKATIEGNGGTVTVNP